MTLRFAMLWKKSCVNFFIIVFSFSIPHSVLADEEIPVYGHVPDFMLTERSGKEVKLADLKENVWIADFIFTRCQGQCPMLSGRMAVLQGKLNAPQIKLVSFSVDPEFDTPKILSEYATRYHAQKDKWLFLTGSKTEMWNLITDGFKLGVDQASPEDLKAGAEPVMHTNRFVLVDQEGNIRGYYDSSDSQEMDRLIKNVSSLASQSKQNVMN